MTHPIVSEHAAQLALVEREVVAQVTRWGYQHWPNGTGSEDDHRHADLYRAACDTSDAAGSTTWRQILVEEVFEAFAEEDDDKLAAELVQVAAVAVSWLRDIMSRRTAAELRAAADDGQGWRP
jgi:hypothetical protein